MKLFKKKIEAFDFGKLLYVMIIDFLSNEESPVELKKLISTLKIKNGDLSNNLDVEAIILLAYQTFIIILNKFDNNITYIILKGMKYRFITHFIELGMPESKSEFLRDLFEERFKEYNEAEKLESIEIIQEWVIIFLKNILIDDKGFLNIFLWPPVAQFITKGTELMSNYLELSLSKCKIVN
jgi:hypothetical protein